MQAWATQYHDPPEAQRQGDFQRAGAMQQAVVFEVMRPASRVPFADTASAASTSESIYVAWRRLYDESKKLFSGQHINDMIAKPVDMRKLITLVEPVTF